MVGENQNEDAAWLRDFEDKLGVKVSNKTAIEMRPEYDSIKQKIRTMMRGMTSQSHIEQGSESYNSQKSFIVNG